MRKPKLLKYLLAGLLLLALILPASAESWMMTFSFADGREVVRDFEDQSSMFAAIREFLNDGADGVLTLQRADGEKLTMTRKGENVSVDMMGEVTSATVEQLKTEFSEENLQAPPPEDAPGY